jgi:hypothetical protein
MLGHFFGMNSLIGGRCAPHPWLITWLPRTITTMADVLMDNSFNFWR